MLDDEPLMDDMSSKNFNEGIGCHVSSALVQTLLLSRDMVELQGLRKNEIFLNTKRYLGIVWCQPLVDVFLFKTHNYHAYILVLFVMVLIPFPFFFCFLGYSKYF